MSTHTYLEQCPDHCGYDAEYARETQPLEHTNIACNHCGYYLQLTVAVEGRLDLDALNYEREIRDLKPLKQLPKKGW